MENKETKNNKTEELSDEVLDEVTGGVYQVKSATTATKVAGGVQQSKSVKTPSGTITVPTKPVGGYKEY